jgi:sugar/nucleoside kinase (ribokinase family)
MSAKDLRRYGELCAWTLARAHARGGDRVAIASYLGDDDTFARAVTAFAATYADRTELDHAALATAVAAGRITATTEL